MNKCSILTAKMQLNAALAQRSADSPVCDQNDSVSIKCSKLSKSISMRVLASFHFEAPIKHGRVGYPSKNVRIKVLRRARLSNYLSGFTLDWQKFNGEMHDCDIRKY
jgi:hypothetical protein